MEKKNILQQNWWETCSCVSRVFSQRDHIPLRETINSLDAYQEQGVGAIEIFAPYHGGNQYGALDPYNFFIVDPAIGTMADFLELVTECHKRRMAVIIFINVGYAAMENADFLKAQDDVKRGIVSRETQFFLWDDTGETPFERTFSHYFGKAPEGYWQFSQRAGKYYWVKWRGFQNDAALPQYNFASREWRDECKKIIRFWMDTGIDGMIIDAPYSYVNCDFQTNNECITNIIREYPNQYIQPEGGGAAGESLERWLVDAQYNSLQDYSLCTGWDQRSAIYDAICTGDVSQLEEKFQSWRDKVTSCGGTTYLGVIWGKSMTPEQRLLEFVTIVTTGAMLHDDNKLMKADFPRDIRKKLAGVLTLCATTPALRLNGGRKVMQAHDGCYGIKRFDSNGNEALVILNFLAGPRDITIHVDEKLLLKNAFTGQRISCDGDLTVSMDGYGYEIFLVEK